MVFLILCCVLNVLANMMCAAQNVTFKSSLAQWKSPLWNNIIIKYRRKHKWLDIDFCFKLPVSLTRVGKLEVKVHITILPLDKFISRMCLLDFNNSVPCLSFYLNQAVILFLMQQNHIGVSTLFSYVKQLHCCRHVVYSW